MNHLRKLVKQMTRRHDVLNDDLDKQRDLAKESINTMEDLYLRFEREKQHIRLEIEKEYEVKLQEQKQKYDKKV